MIEDLNISIAAKVATYFQVSDLISLSQVSPCMRHYFSQYAWSKVFVVSHKVLKNGTGRAFKTYQYFVISEEMLIKLSDYRWIKGDFVRQLVLSPMCNLMKPKEIDQINIKKCFPYLQSIHLEAHHTIKTRGNRIGFGPGSSFDPYNYPNARVKRYIGRFTYQKPSMLISQVLSTVPQNIQIASILLEDERLFNITSNLSTLTSLQISYVMRLSNFIKLTNNLKLCFNLQRFVFMPLQKLTKYQYSLLYSVINKHLLQLKQLKILYNYNISNHSEITTIQKMSNRHLEYFEVSIKLDRDSCIYSERKASWAYKFSRIARFFKKPLIHLSGVQGLELLTVPQDNKLMKFPKLRKKIHAPDLQHFKSRMLIISDYMNHILLPVKEKLVTLNVGVMEGFNFALFVSCLPEFENLKNLVIEHMDNTKYLWRAPSSLLEDAMAKYKKNRWQYNWVYSQIRDRDIDFDKIQNLCDSDVKKIVVDILQKGEINDFYKEAPRYSYECFINTVVGLIKCPEKSVHYYSKIFNYRDQFFKSYENFIPMIYSFWDSIYNICKNLTKLEILKMVQRSVPFVSPHFSSFVHNHKSDRLKFVTIDIIGKYSEWICPEEINKLTYAQYVYKIKAPFVYKYMEPYMGVIDHVGELYMVDTEALRNKFGVSKKFRKEEMEYSSSYLGSSFKVKNIKKHQEVMTGLTKEPRLSIIGPMDIRNMAVNLNNRY